MKLRLITLLCLCLVLSACPAMAPGSKPYAPRPDSYEATLFSKAQREVFPADVRKDPEKYRETILLWTGIIRDVARDGNTLITSYDHHYWDWTEDYSIQKEVIFLSPRGEGHFQCVQNISELAEPKNFISPERGHFAIVYGKLDSVSPDGNVLLNCAPLIKTLSPKLFGTDIWSYGRDYLLKGDKSDLKVLRVPF